MSDNEYERFEITDYDLDNEFNPNRPRRRQTKHQQIYGIWADESDSDESGGKGRNRRGGRGGMGASGSKSKNDSAPVSFVAGGIQQAGKKKEKIAEDGGESAGTTDEEGGDGARPSFGRSPENASSSSDEQAARPSRRKIAPPKEQRTFARSSILTDRERNVGAWQQHTRGIGAKLLLQMGYEPGRGLGKDLQGIAQPVEAHVRKGRGAIGAYGPEKKTKPPGQEAKAKEDDDIREAKEFKEKINKWRKGGDAGPEKVKRYYYKTVEELIEKSKDSNLPLSDRISKKLRNVPVIDMTGPETRILSGYHAISRSKILDEDLYQLDNATAAAITGPNKASAADTFALPELMHNVDLIVSMCEQDIISLDNVKRDAIDRGEALRSERKSLEEIVVLEEAHIDTLQRALALVEQLTDDDDISLDRAEKVFLELQHKYAAEYKEFSLSDLAAGIVAPLAKRHLADWKPLQKPTEHIEIIKRWRAILDTQARPQSDGHNVFDPYSSLVWAGVIPSFRACATMWNPKEHHAMATLLECWAPLFPSWILDSVLEQLVLPRLVTGVKEWDPLTDTVPIHIWILPWNGILGHKLEEAIFPTIRDKLGAALRAWIPQDRSARAMLTPWKGSFDDAEMQIFLMQHIIPKLQLALGELIINPLQQDLELWNQVWEWHELLPPMLMADLLDKCFFPKWMQVLVMWLNQSPDYAEISRWYSGWKSMLSEGLLREPSVKEHLRRALEMMHRATETAPLAAGMPTVLTSTPPPPPPPSLMELQISAPSQIEFKELVSQKCAERGILFAPMPGRRELGKQVYRVGKLYCHIDRNVCMLSDASFKSWLPSSLGQLLERAVTGVL